MKARSIVTILMVSILAILLMGCKGGKTPVTDPDTEPVPTGNAVNTAPTENACQDAVNDLNKEIKTQQKRFEEVSDELRRVLTQLQHIKNTGTEEEINKLKEQLEDYAREKRELEQSIEFLEEAVENRKCNEE